MHLAYRWLTGLGFDQEVPHHSTFFTNRHGRFQPFENLFPKVTQICAQLPFVHAPIRTERYTATGNVEMTSPAEISTVFELVTMDPTPTIAHKPTHKHRIGQECFREAGSFSGRVITTERTLDFEQSLCCYPRLVFTATRFLVDLRSKSRIRPLADRLLILAKFLQSLNKLQDLELPGTGATKRSREFADGCRKKRLAEDSDRQDSAE